MKLSEYLNQDKILINKKGILLDNINLDNGEKRKKGEVVSILMENKDGTFHAEDNDFACKLNKNEFKFI